MMTDRAIPPGDCGGEIQAQLQAMAEEIVSRITALDAPVSTEQLLGGLVSELFLTAAKERQRAERRRERDTLWDFQQAFRRSAAYAAQA